MADRLNIKWPAVHALLKAPGIQEQIKDLTRRIDAKAASLGTQSRVDFSADGERARGAVIAGYETEATAENTRRILLSAVDGE